MLSFRARADWEWWQWRGTPHFRSFACKLFILHRNTCLNICWHPVQMSSTSILPIDRTLSSAITPGLSGAESDGNERVLCIPQSSSITGASPSDCFVSYPGHWLGGEGFLLPYRKAVGVFYSPSRLGKLSGHARIEIRAWPSTIERPSVKFWLSVIGLNTMITVNFRKSVNLFCILQKSITL